MKRFLLLNVSAHQWALKTQFLGSREEYGALCGRMNKKHYGAASTCLSHSTDCLLLLLGLMQCTQTRSTNPQEKAYPTTADSKSGGPNFESKQALQKKYVG
jgi:hypothetical protein